MALLGRWFRDQHGIHALQHKHCDGPLVSSNGIGLVTKQSKHYWGGVRERCRVESGLGLSPADIDAQRDREGATKYPPVPADVEIVGLLDVDERRVPLATGLMTDTWRLG